MKSKVDLLWKFGKFEFVELYRLLYIRELNSHVNECPGGNLIWALRSVVVIWCEHECPGWSFDVSTNVRGGHLMWARMSGMVIWCEHECPALSKIAWERMSVGTNVRTPSLLPCRATYVCRSVAIWYYPLLRHFLWLYEVKNSCFCRTKKSNFTIKDDYCCLWKASKKV